MKSCARPCWGFRSRDQYAMLLDFAPIGYVTLDKRGVLVDANHKASALMGMERWRLLGRRFLEFTSTSSRSSFALLPPRLLANESRKRHDSHTVPVRLEGRVHASGLLLIALSDISVEKGAQEKLLRLNETLERRVEERALKIRELSEELRTVVLAVAEDLMTVLWRPVTAFLEVLQRGSPGLDSTQVTHFNHVFRSVSRMDELARALAEYTLVSFMRVRIAPLDLNRVLDEVRKDLRPLLANRSVSLTNDALPNVQGDSAAMQLVFFELLENALKFTSAREDARIHVSAMETESEVILRFEDNGAGFNNRYKDKLFKVFKRLHSESACQGTGIGLALVRRVCLRFGGRVGRRSSGRGRHLLRRLAQAAHLAGVTAVRAFKTGRRAPRRGIHGVPRGRTPHRASLRYDARMSFVASHVIVVTGVMAAGKSTVAQRLAERLERSVHLRGDVFRRMIVRGRADPTPDVSREAEEQLALRYRLATNVARAYVEANFTVVYQDVILEQALPLVLSLLDGLRVTVVVLDPSPDVVARREAARGKIGYGDGWTVEALVASLHRTPRVGMWLDTSNLTPDETVDVILQRAARVGAAVSTASEEPLA
ncbi:ATP-binding protein [Deinococcus yavapaiensis]|nr:ATP-binding protein [Deinococcus yavapaiensis]